MGRILLLLTAVPPRRVLPHTRLGTTGGSPGWWLLTAAPWEMGNEGQKGGDAGKRPPRRGSTGLSSTHGSVGRRKKGEKRQVSPEEEALTCSPAARASRRAPPAPSRCARAAPGSSSRARKSLLMPLEIAGDVNGEMDTDALPLLRSMKPRAPLTSSAALSYEVGAGSSPAGLAFLLRFQRLHRGVPTAPRSRFIRSEEGAGGEEGIRGKIQGKKSRAAAGRAQDERVPVRPRRSPASRTRPLPPLLPTESSPNALQANFNFPSYFHALSPTLAAQDS